MPTISEYSGQFWTGVNESPVLESYAAISALLTDKATRQSPGHVSGWTIRTLDRLDRTAGTANAGRPVFGYPAPYEAPDWVALDLVGGPVLVAGVDFVVSDGYVWFDEDPLLTATVRRLVWIDGKPIEVADLIYCHTDDPPLLRYDSATALALSQAIAKACDSPATTQTETVEDVWQGFDGEWRVVTDTATYRLTQSDTPSVGVGDIIPPGTPLGSAWVLTRLGPEKPTLAHLTVPAAYHQGVTTGGITWYDQVESVLVDTVDGRTRVRWILGGSQADVDAFWTASHATGTAPGGRSLAQAMDTRGNPTGDPGPANLPATVNPLEFVCRELFAGNAHLLVIQTDRLGPDAVNPADRKSAVTQAAGPYVTVFEYENTVPALPEVLPS